jgi:hypothetical protein
LVLRAGGSFPAGLADWASMRFSVASIFWSQAATFS